MHTKTIAAVLASLTLSAAAGIAQAQAKVAPPAKSPPAITMSSPAGSSSTVIGTSYSAGDEALLKRVVSALSVETDLRGAFISVGIEGDTLQLTGTADTPMQAARAGEVAKAAAGTAQVVNEIRSGGLK